MRFKVKKNPFFVALILFVILLGLSIIIVGQGEIVSIISGVLTILLIFPFIWAIFFTYHEITNQELIIVFGFYKKKIPLQEIKSIAYTTNPLSAPAWTFRRMEVHYGKFDMILISIPKNEKLFLETLHEKAPHILIK